MSDHGATLTSSERATPTSNLGIPSMPKLARKRFIRSDTDKSLLELLTVKDKLYNGEQFHTTVLRLLFKRYIH